MNLSQESIPVGSVPPAFLVPGGLSNPLDTDPPCKQTPSPREQNDSFERKIFQNEIYKIYQTRWIYHKKSFR